MHVTSVSRRLARPTGAHTLIRCSHNAHQPLEKAVQTINKIISLNTRSSSSTSAAPGKPKTVGFSARCKASKPVQDICEDSSKSLPVYLALPLEQYSLLDPTWIQRGEQDNEFVLRVPLIDLIGIDMVPGLTIQVHIDPEVPQVRFVADQFTCGDPKLDAEFTVELHGTLSSSAMDPSGSHSQPVEAGGVIHLYPWHQLKCSADMTMTVQVPHPLSMVPRPLLSSTGSLLMKIAMQALAPAFLEMLSVDFKRWAQGHMAARQLEAAGSLVSIDNGGSLVSSDTDGSVADKDAKLPSVFKLSATVVD